MFVVDGVELVFLHQSHQMGKLHSDDAARIQQNLHSCDKVIDVRNMSKHVVAEQEVGLLAFGRQFASGITVKEFYKSGHALFNRPFNNICSMLNAQERNLYLNQILKQIAIVDSNFDNETLLCYRESL